MQFLLVAISCVALLASCACLPPDAPEIKSWSQFKRTFGKTYASPEEELRRKEAFSQSLAWIEQNQGRHGAHFAMNQFSDLSRDEFVAQHTMSGINISELYAMWNTESGAPVPAAQYADLPQAYDWREHMHTNAVQSQRSCSSCWSFATATVTEMLHSIRRNRTVRLSKQEMVDCASNGTKYRNLGCKGGYTVTSFLYIEEHGLLEEDHYPYVGHESSCHAQSEGPRFHISKSTMLRHQASDREMMQALLEHGPLVVMVHGAVDAFRFYHGNGILQGVSFNDSFVDHIVVLLGWGRRNDLDYWIIRNSWGTDWGDNGYLYLERNHNSIGVNNYPVYADL